MTYFQNYYHANKDNILERLSNNQKQRYKEDIEFKLFKRVQARIKNELPEWTSGPGLNDGTIEELLGCSLSFLLKWIKFNINKYPDWDNIHLHHVRPISTFSKHKHNAFHWTNTLPIDKHNNLSIKNTRNKYEEDQQIKRINQFLLATEISSNE